MSQQREAFFVYARRPRLSGGGGVIRAQSNLRLRIGAVLTERNGRRTMARIYFSDGTNTGWFDAGKKTYYATALANYRRWSFGAMTRRPAGGGSDETQI